MENISTTELKYNPAAFSNIFNVKKDVTITNANIMVLFPDRYINRKLVLMDNVISIVAIYAIVDENNNYCTVLAPIFQTMTPNLIRDVNVDGEPYKALYFDAGDVFIPNNKLIVRDSFIYDLFDEFFIKGKVPWFLNYEQLSNLFAESKKYANTNVGADSMAFEILTAIISRYNKDKKVYFRTVVDKSNRNALTPTYVGLNNPYYSFDSTGAKLIGSRFGTGLIVGMVEPETKTSVTTDILRS